MITAALMLVAGSSLADEGMWLFNHPPTVQLERRYGFNAARPWLDHLQKSSIRFNIGGSGAFVSPDALLITNQHVGLGCLQTISTAAKDFVAAGYYARNYKDEVKCADLELSVLMSVDDVTGTVNAAVTRAMNNDEGERARRSVMNEIEKESADKTGLRSEVVTLFQGGEYHLYRYKVYDDVRLVFAPEAQAAFYGGDSDNFEYPRYALDICFFRAYEHGKPAHPADFLRYSRSPMKEGELIFVAGHPDRTNRLNTVSHLRFLRDRSYPTLSEVLRRREVLLDTYSERSIANEQRAYEDLREIKNSRKVIAGRLAGLQEPAVFARKKAAEAALRAKVMNDPALREAYGDPWAAVDAAMVPYSEVFWPRTLLEHAYAFNSRLFNIARTLVRLGDEVPKANGERLREYRESNISSLKGELLSEAPIHQNLEIVMLADSLAYWVEKAGADDPLVKQFLDGKSPRERASELVRGTRLADVSVRKRLADAGNAALDRSDDPMIVAARLVDGAARAARKVYEDDCDEPLRKAYARIANEQFATSGGTTYPDATSTLRLSYGVVKGYDENGEHIPASTTFAALFTRSAEHKNRPPFDVPARWLKKKGELDLDTPLDFVHTADISEGSSGSPVVNRAGEFVGIVFDGNQQGIPWDYAFNDRAGRGIAVGSEAIIEALRSVYGADDLAEELSGNR